MCLKFTRTEMLSLFKNLSQAPSISHGLRYLLSFSEIASFPEFQYLLFQDDDQSHACYIRIWCSVPASLSRMSSTLYRNPASWSSSLNSLKSSAWMKNVARRLPFINLQYSTDDRSIEIKVVFSKSKWDFIRLKQRRNYPPFPTFEIKKNAFRVFFDGANAYAMVLAGIN